MGYIFIYPYLSVIEWHSIPTHICLKAKPPKWMIWTTVSKAVRCRITTVFPDSHELYVEGCFGYLKGLNSNVSCLLSRLWFLQLQYIIQPLISSQWSGFIHVWPPSVVYICNVSYQRLNNIVSTLCASQRPCVIFLSGSTYICRVAFLDISSFFIIYNII